MLLWNHFRCFGMFWVLHTLYRRVRRPRRTASNDWHNLSRRGAQCAPTQRQIKRFGSFLAQAPVVLWAHTVRPYDIACADGLHGAPRSYPRAPSLAALPQFTLSHPTENRSIIFLEMKKWRMADRYINSPFSIFNSQLFITIRTNQTDWRIHSCRSRHSAANYRSGCSGSAGSGHSGHCPRGRANRSA